MSLKRTALSPKRKVYDNGISLLLSGMSGRKTQRAADGTRGDENNPFGADLDLADLDLVPEVC